MRYYKNKSMSDAVHAAGVTDTRADPAFWGKRSLLEMIVFSKMENGQDNRQESELKEIIRMNKILLLRNIKGMRIKYLDLC